MVLADSDRITRVPPYLGYPLSWFVFSRTGLSPSLAALSRAVPLTLSQSYRGPATPGALAYIEFGLIFPRSLATTDGIEFSFFSSRY